ncbi:hypothetical protein TL16_g09401 [Triparma laevis f. inornata]|uniref:Transcriptional coactivator p15 (PC4) C-terminal domain-containing protein n=1 Tax=Triparma laevis f. inornata TaxID=1714386 RepID=A0A9W7BAZ9_9STRA|nr:hypothetical protein TL16_g09401 [Triparma laevis f. inornata]
MFPSPPTLSPPRPPFLTLPPPQAIETDPILTENTAETNVVAQCTDEAEKKRKLSSAPVDASAIFTKVDNNGQEEFRAKLTDKGMKRLTVSSYRGAKTIHIREYYEKDGKEVRYPSNDSHN